MAYFLIAGLLASYIVWLRRDALTSVLAVALAVSFASYFMLVDYILPLLGILDGLTAFAMLLIWSRKWCLRAWLVALISFGKSGITLAQYVVEPIYYGWDYVIVINAAFVLQLLIGGGIPHGLATWADTLCRRLFPRWVQLLRHEAD